MLRIPICLLFLAALAQAAAGPFAISGTVVDPTGAVVPAAVVSLRNASEPTTRESQTDTHGVFHLSGLAAGRYQISLEQPGFAPVRLEVTVTDKQAAPLRIALKLTDVRQQLTVNETAEQISTAASDNAGAVTLDRSLLDSLPIFDQDYIAAIRQFLDPGSVSTAGVTLVVDGMEQKNIGVSASAIQQVKINQNPYSAEYSRPGRGAIEVVTKPASQRYHGAFNFLFRDQHLNARDPFAIERPPEQKRTFEGSLIGPLGRSRRTSFLLSVNREEQDLQAVVFANTLGGLVRANVANPLRNTEFAVGLTHPYSDSHIGSVRTNYRVTTDNNRGAGGLTLPGSGVNYRDTEYEVYYNDSYTFTPTLLNQMRVLVGRQYTPTTSVTSGPAFVVPGAFTGGGAQADRLQTEVHGNFNDILSWSHGRHEVKTGINVPDVSRRGLNDLSNFAGTYTYATLADFAVQRPFSYIAQRGDGHAIFMEEVIGAFVRDEIRLAPGLTMAAGLRFDWQNFFHDNNNFSPRLALAWAPGKGRKTVLRTGAGLFFDRTGPGPIFDLERYNGIRLRQTVLTSPAYPAAFDFMQPTSVVRLDPTVKIPYTAQFSAGLDRQLVKGTTVSVNYWAVRGVSLYRSRDVNAPPPPNYLTRPASGISVFRQIESSGHLQSDALEATFRGRITTRFTGMIQYTLGRSWNDVPGNYTGGTRSTGINSFPANNYDLSGEWGRADYDQRHRFNMLGSFHAARYADFGIGLAANTGGPYTITTGRDDYHTGYANARPPGAARNTAAGPGLVNLDIRWSHSFLLAKRKEGPRADVSLDGFNAVNHVNYVSYLGNLSSPFFGQAISARPPRRLQLSLKLAF